MIYDFCLVCLDKHEWICIQICIFLLFFFRPEDLHRIRVEHMERQLANLTGLVQKALTQNVPSGPVVSMNQNYLGVNQYRGGK